jgi:TonB family protein
MSTAAAHTATLELNREHARIRRRTKRGVIWSSVAHLIVLVLMAMKQHLAPEPLALTEITWLDPVEATPAPAAPAVASPEPQRPEPASVTPQVAKTVHFKRAEKPAPAKPKPQNSRAIQDRLQERLAALRQNAPKLPQTVANANAQPRMSQPVVSTPLQSVTSPVDLKRGRSLQPQPSALVRQSQSPAPRLELAAAPERKMEAALVEDTSPMVREIAGAQLMGPVADRALVSHRVPDYPDAAMREAREGSVTLRFFVQTNGMLKENILVEQTSGHADIDRKAVEALHAWQFEALPGGATGEQWGTITFHFKISVTNLG